MNGREKPIAALFDLEMVGESFFKSTTNIIDNHCVPDSGHIPRMTLTLP